MAGLAERGTSSTARTGRLPCPDDPPCRHRARSLPAAPLRHPGAHWRPPPTSGRPRGRFAAGGGAREGPPFIRLSSNAVVYDVRDLDARLAARARPRVEPEGGPGPGSDPDPGLGRRDHSLLHGDRLMHGGHMNDRDVVRPGGGPGDRARPEGRRRLHEDRQRRDPRPAAQSRCSVGRPAGVEQARDWVIHQGVAAGIPGCPRGRIKRAFHVLRPHGYDQHVLPPGGRDVRLDRASSFTEVPGGTRRSDPTSGVRRENTASPHRRPQLGSPLPRFTGLR